MATIRYDCPHCAASHVSFLVTAANQVDVYNWNVLAECGGCRFPVCARVWLPTVANPASYSKALNGDDSNWIVQGIWPANAESEAPDHTPPNVARRFLEGENSFKRQSWNAAVAMYRSALDIATKALDGVPSGLTFYRRLEWLHDEHRITPDMKDWADHVRIEGNDALHDPDDFTEDDAKPLRLFTEMFLRYMFELPGEVSAFRAGAAEAIPVH